MYPINSYEGLKNFLHFPNDTDNPYSRVLSQFKLFGIIVYDPNLHNDFHQLLQNGFERFDRHTGDKVLYFTTAQPPEGWHERNNYRSYHTVLENLNKPDNEKDSTIDVYGFCNYLELDFNNLPLILLSDNLNSRKFISIKTNAQLLAEQFELISEFCDRVRTPFNIETDLDFKNLVRNLNDGQNNFYINRAASIAEAMVDLFTLEDENLQEKVFKEFIEKMNRRINYFRSKLRENEENYFAYERIEQLAIFFATSLAKICSRRYGNTNPIIALSDGYEHESYILQDTLNSIQEFLSTNNSNVDYSIGVIPLSKIFEIEVNLSFVQYVRESLDIEMPTYFNKFYPSSHDYNIRTSLKAPYVNFNQKTKSNDFLPPAIGQTKFIVNYYYRNNRLPKVFNANFQDFLRQWDIVHEIRNKAAHSSRVNIEDYNKVLSAFERIQNRGYAQNIIELKNQIRERQLD